MNFLILFLFMNSQSFALANNEPGITWYRAEARSILRKSDCGRCHIPPGNSKALKIYDLDQVNWDAEMSDHQVRQIKWRIDATNEDLAKKGGKRQYLLSKSEVELLHDFVDREILNRKIVRATR